jgi:hypothetical protein
MGIDAEILIRYRGERPTDTQLTRWSWDLCNSVGAKHFFISDGLPPDEHNIAEKAWHAAFDAHPLYAKWQSKTDHTARNEVCTAIVADIGEPPKEMRRAIELTHRRYPLDEDSGVPLAYRASGLCWTQDGETLYANPGEHFLEVSLWTRYYGIGYERGDLLTICAVAEWIEANLQPCEVWYGGDSSGVCVEPFGEAQRHALRRHLYGKQGREYFGYFADKSSFPTPKPCGLCVAGENRFNQHGFGGGYVAVNCGGCGKSFETRDGGATWAEAKD